jgi:hypothetical protein
MRRIRTKVNRIGNKNLLCNERHLIKDISKKMITNVLYSDILNNSKNPMLKVLCRSDENYEHHTVNLCNNKIYLKESPINLNFLHTNTNIIKLIENNKLNKI